MDNNKGRVEKGKGGGKVQGGWEWRGEGRKLYLNNNKKMLKKTNCGTFTQWNSMQQKEMSSYPS